MNVMLNIHKKAAKNKNLCYLSWPKGREKISLVTFDFLKFSKQLTGRTLCGNFQKSPEKVTRLMP